MFPLTFSHRWSGRESRDRPLPKIAAIPTLLAPWLYAILPYLHMVLEGARL